MKKCSLKEHSNINAISFCIECKIYMCHKCEKIHSGLCQNHSPYKIGNNEKEIFTGFCRIEKHNNNELEYFCKTHNQLCCAACIAKIKRKGKGQHSDCDIYIIEDVKEEKKKILEGNLNKLTELSNTIKESTNKLIKLYEKVNRNKEELKLSIQKVFTDIRNIINNREDELLDNVEKQFNSYYFKEDIMKEIEKLPNILIKSLEKRNEIEKEFNNQEKLNLFINDCLDIENNIYKINKLYEALNKLNNYKDLKIKYNSEDNQELNKLIKTIKDFGIIYNKTSNNKYKFKKLPLNKNENDKYSITGENENIITKIGNSQWIGAICENKLENKGIYKWKIKILKTKSYNLMAGVAPIDFDINTSFYSTYGWYIYCLDSSLYSGPPHNLIGEETKLKKVKDEIIIILNLDKKTIKFIIDGEDKGEIYSNISTDKPLTPAVFLNNINDSLEISEC